MSPKLLFVALLLAFAPPAFAHECLDKAATQAGLNDCVAKDFKAADAELNQLYTQISNRMEDPGRRKLLTAGQRAWLAFRDAECAFVSSAAEGGSAQPMVHSQCLAASTRKRIGDFRKYLSCAEGDLACPVPPTR